MNKTEIIEVLIVAATVCICWQGWPSFITINKVTKNYFVKGDKEKF